MTNIEITNTADPQVIGYLERQNDCETIRQLKVHYTSLLNTALAYENFDLDDFESCLSWERHSE